jgi:hypothetical protein
MTTLLHERARRAGTQLSAATIHWGRRPTEAPAIAVTARDLALLERLHEVGYLAASHLFLLGWGRQTTRGWRRLKTLHDVGLVDKFRAPREAGSHEWNYRLTETGWQTLVQARLAPASPRYRPPELHAIAYAEHDLQVNGLILNLAHDPHANPAPLHDRIPFQWSCRSAHVALRRREPPATMSAAAAAALRATTNRARSLPGHLEPDAVLRGRDADGRRLTVLVEYDRTRQPSTQIDRLRRYDRFLLDGWANSPLADDDEPPVILYVSSTDDARDALAHAADRALSASTSPTTPSGRTIYPGRSNVLFTTRTRLLERDWTVRHLTPEPTAGDHSGGTRAPLLTGHFPLGEIFASPR